MRIRGLALAMGCTPQKERKRVVELFRVLWGVLVSSCGDSNEKIEGGWHRPTALPPMNTVHALHRYRKHSLSDTTLVGACEIPVKSLNTSTVIKNRVIYRCLGIGELAPSLFV